MSRRRPLHTFSRRQALALLGTAGAASLVGLGRRTRAFGLSCVASPAQTEGPFFVDELLERSDLTVDPSDGSITPGAPLRLQINVARTDESCSPAAGVQVDVWHTDARGAYSDEAPLGTRGRMFLRGHQITDQNGAVVFTTVYPGWYPGRTIHIHFKVRTFEGSRTTSEFTSQLYFDDAISDQVLARAPYAGRGVRDTTNATDGIFAADGPGLTLALTDDGRGGYAGTFTVALAGLPARPGDGACADLVGCAAALEAALPDPATAASRGRRRVARRLARLGAKGSTALASVATVEESKRAGRRRKARAVFQKLLTVAQAADRKGTLGVSLAALEATIAALLVRLPAA